MVAPNTMFPRLGLGMAALGRPGYINLDRGSIFGSDQHRSVETMQKQAYLVMDQLFSLNEVPTGGDDEVDPLNRPWLDCARSYGLSEKFVGEYLRSKKVTPSSVFVSSKWGYTYVADFKVRLPEGQQHEVKDHSTENFLKQVQETNDFFGEYIDLYQIHSATFDSGILTDTRAHEALAQCRNERGWLLGLSVSSPQQSDIIRTAMKIKVDGVSLFDSVQCTYNVLEQSPGVALQEARDAGMDVIIKEGLANGRVLRNPAIIEYSKKLSCKPDQLALGCILAQAFEPRVLSGAVSSEQLESNWESLVVAETLRENPALLEEIMAACRMGSKDYWSERSALAWN